MEWRRLPCNCSLPVAMHTSDQPIPATSRGQVRSAALRRMAIQILRRCWAALASGQFVARERRRRRSWCRMDRCGSRGGRSPLHCESRPRWSHQNLQQIFSWHWLWKLSRTRRRNTAPTIAIVLCSTPWLASECGKLSTSIMWIP
jgi:hypothetical protein